MSDYTKLQSVIGKWGKCSLLKRLDDSVRVIYCYGFLTERERNEIRKRINKEYKKEIHNKKLTLEELKKLHDSPFGESAEKLARMGGNVTE